MSSIWDRIGQYFKEDNRKDARKQTSRLVAYYWDGATPVPHPIRDISQSGAYLLTEQHWRPGTIVTMTLQRNAENADEALRSIAIQAKVVRQGGDGVGLRFVLTLPSRSRDDSAAMGGTADKKTLLAFLDAVGQE